MMRTAVLAVLAMTCGSLTAAAQTTDAGYWDMLSPSTATTVKTVHASIRRNLAETAAAMPPGDYAFKPAQEARSFGEVIGHLINANFAICSQIRGEKSPGTQNYEKVTDKAALAKSLEEAMTYCDGVYESTTDANAQALVQLTGPASKTTQTPRGVALLFNSTHNNEHYGNLVVYLRLKGHVPPSTARARAARK